MTNHEEMLQTWVGNYQPGATEMEAIREMNDYTVTYEVRYKGENPGPHIVHVFTSASSKEYAEGQTLRILNREGEVESAKLVYTSVSLVCVHCRRLTERYLGREPFEIRCANGHLVELGTATDSDSG